MLKIIWRDQKRGSEGEVLARAKGMFGVAQYVWHYDFLTKFSRGLDETFQPERLEVSAGLKGTNDEGALASGKLHQSFVLCTFLNGFLQTLPELPNTPKWLISGNATFTPIFYHRLLGNSCGTPEARNDS